MSEEEIVNDWPDNECFACSPHNPRGLHMVFRRVGPRAYECRYEAGAELSGFEGVIHGGLQATLLDDTMAMVARAEAGQDAAVVTAELNVRYRRPAPIEQPLTIRAELERVEGRRLWILGRIVDDAGDVLTTAEASWVHLGPAGG